MSLVYAICLLILPSEVNDICLVLYHQLTSLSCFMPIVGVVCHNFHNYIIFYIMPLNVFLNVRVQNGDLKFW